MRRFEEVKLDDKDHLMVDGEDILEVLEG